jgi:hypothetical protein
MEQNFQTSFIPKKSMMVEEQTTSSKKPIGFLMIISIFVFLTVMLASGGLYLYRGMLQKNISDMDANLALAKERFEPATINRLQVLGKRLESSNIILSKHIAISPIFNTLQKLTLKTIRYSKFGYEFGNEKDSRILVKMSGQAIGYRSIALQADLFTKDKNLIDPTFSNLSLDDKGNVLFDLEFSVDPSFVDYKQILLSEGEVSPGTISDSVEIPN